LQDNRGISYADLVHPEDRESLQIKRQSALDAHTPFHGEYRIVDRHGVERWLSERATGVHDPFGKLLFIDGFIQDITASREAEIEREQLNRKMQETQKLESLGVLAGGIAHDFNNLLTGIIGNASMAGMDLPENSPIQRYIKQIDEASMRAADLCKQMLAYSGRGRFFVQRVDLGRLVEDTAQMLQISISKKAALQFNIEHGLPPIEADPTQIRQVVMNLVINASEAIGEKGGVISLSIGLSNVDREYLDRTMLTPDLPAGEYLFVEISDNGCGMSAETQARIFDPFFTTKFTGRGLGLAAVLGIVRGHKGAMKVDSERGVGTTFRVLFPASAGTVDAVPARPSVQTGWRGEGTVLVVEDEEAIRNTVGQMLLTMGLDPVLSADGREALEVFRAEPGRFTLVLLDLTMPHMDGEQTFTELRQIRDDVRVVLMSGFNQQDVLVRFSGKGLASFLQKPFSITSLSEVLQSVLG
jgi:signal transduction histidine kinase/CheY-like chemotaxis protein